MAIDWNQVRQLPAMDKVIASLRQVIRADNYGFGPGDWNMTELVQESDQRKYVAFQMIEGIDHERRRDTNQGLGLTYRLRVLTRQACVRDKAGNRIWPTNEPKINLGNPEDIVPNHEDLPEPGDVVEWKGSVKATDDRGNIVDAKIIRRWALQGIRPENYHEFEVDKDLCINVRYPQIIEMLTRKGRKLSYPQFRKINKASKEKRRITNWWFEEVPIDYKAPRKPRSDKGVPRSGTGIAMELEAKE
jgi:hypothetical protein